MYLLGICKKALLSVQWWLGEWWWGGMLPYMTAHISISPLWSVTLSTLITRRLWLHYGSEHCLPLSLSCSLSLPLFCSVAHQGPQAPPFSAQGDLLCTCDIGGISVWAYFCMYNNVCVCVLCYFIPFEDSQSQYLADDSHLQRCLLFKRVHAS